MTGQGYVREDLRLPWFHAVCVVLPQLPYVREECLRKGYKGNQNLLAGFCYTASEAIYHLSSDPLKPMVLRFGPAPHQTHWFLKHRETDEIIDVTASQFPATDFSRIYDKARGCGFMTKEPSKRARTVLDRIDLENDYFRRNCHNGQPWPDAWG